MRARLEWQYNETKHCGVDYSRKNVAEAYDSLHMKFRDYEKSADAIIRRLGLGPRSTVIDLGAGTGAFALYAARKCRFVYAVDISAAMLDYCRARAAAAGLNNIAFCHAGLLTYEHNAAPADAAVCIAVLHHLPDFWKSVALSRCARMLKQGGRFFLFDIVFPSKEPALAGKIDEWLSAAAAVDARLAEETVVHLRDEFSTYDWIMEGLIARSGFRLDEIEYGDGFQATYLGTRA